MFDRKIRFFTTRLRNFSGWKITSSVIRSPQPQGLLGHLLAPSRSVAPWPLTVRAAVQGGHRQRQALQAYPVVTGRSYAPRRMLEEIGSHRWLTVSDLGKRTARDDAAERHDYPDYWAFIVGIGGREVARRTMASHPALACWRWARSRAARHRDGAVDRPGRDRRSAGAHGGLQATTAVRARRGDAPVACLQVEVGPGAGG